LAAFLLAAGPLSAAEGRFVNEQYDLVKVADGVYAFVAPESDSGVVQGNSTVVIGEDVALVVDSGQFPSLARRMVADVKKLTSKPVRYLVNTHWHLDHSWGNATRDAYPGVAILGTEYTRGLLEAESPKYIASSAATNRKEVVRLREMLAAGKLPDGRVLTDEMRRRLTRTIDTLEHIEPELAETVNAPPTVGFDKELTVNLGKREVKVMWHSRSARGTRAFASARRTVEGPPRLRRDRTTAFPGVSLAPSSGRIGRESQPDDYRSPPISRATFARSSGSS
jgi:hypothetical protein